MQANAGGIDSLVAITPQLFQVNCLDLNPNMPSTPEYLSGKLLDRKGTFVEAGSFLIPEGIDKDVIGLEKTGLCVRSRLASGSG